MGENYDKKINSLQPDIQHYPIIISDLQNNSNEKLASLKILLEESKNELAKYKESQTLSAFFDSEIYSTFKKASRNGSLPSGNNRRSHSRSQKNKQDQITDKPKTIQHTEC